jgi:hypothetical protein
MVTIFSRTVNRIVELIIDQIDRAYDAADHNDTDFRVQVRSIIPKHAELDNPAHTSVGGYGESDYLYKELRTTFGRNLNPRYRVQICCHDDSATAIAKGVFSGR